MTRMGDESESDGFRTYWRPNIADVKATYICLDRARVIPRALETLTGPPFPEQPLCDYAARSGPNVRPLLIDIVGKSAR